MIPKASATTGQLSPMYVSIGHGLLCDCSPHPMPYRRWNQFISSRHTYRPTHNHVPTITNTHKSRPAKLGPNITTLYLRELAARIGI